VAVALVFGGKNARTKSRSFSERERDDARRFLPVTNARLLAPARPEKGAYQEQRADCGNGFQSASASTALSLPCQLTADGRGRGGHGHLRETGGSVLHRRDPRSPADRLSDCACVRALYVRAMYFVCVRHYYETKVSLIVI